LAVRSERFSARLARAKPGYKPTREPGRKKLPPNRFPRLPQKEQALPQFREAPKQNRSQQAVREGSRVASPSPSPFAGSWPDIPLTAMSNPQRKRKWALPADLPVSLGKVESLEALCDRRWGWSSQPEQVECGLEEWSMRWC
jgi:hypothetical protein